LRRKFLKRLAVFGRGGPGRRQRARWVGAGILGSAVAYDLSAAGARAAVLEKTPPASGAAPHSVARLTAFVPNRSRTRLPCILALAVMAGGPVCAERVDTDVAVPMRDGVVLRADVLRPDQGGPFPVLVYRTPYGKENDRLAYTTVEKAVQRGYAVVVQDVRGRYRSDGEFRPYENEGRDGFDTIEWAARQPWSNGAIGTFGLSYPGAVQWLAAVQTPPHLKAMVPAMTFSSAQNFFFAGGTWDMSWIDWIWFNIAPDVRVKRDLAGYKTTAEVAASWDTDGPQMHGYLPLAGLPQMKQTASYYYDWLGHPAEDPWWDWADLRNKYPRTHAAVLNLSAWYDDNYGPEGATTNFNGLLRARAGQSNAHTHLLLGSWVHGVTSTAEAKSGEREFPLGAAIDYDEVVLRWMDHYLRGIDNAVDREKPVRYFVMGSNEWRDAPAWPPAASATVFYLQPGAASNAGALTRSQPVAQHRAETFVADPSDPVVNEYSESGAHDYRKLADRSDVLTFDSPPLARDLEVTGPIRAHIFVACDCRDLDLWVRLLDVSPEGTAFNLMSPGLDVQRASYRDLARGRQWLTPNKIYEIHLDNLITSNSFLSGHRIRVQISASFFPNFSRNLQSGKSEVTSADMRTARISVYADSKHASQLILPVIDRNR
jgi:putative CocE/NonD family hydrolase